MVKNQNENKILFTVIVVTIVVLAILFFNVVKKQTPAPYPEQREPSGETVLEKDAETTPQPESLIEEGLFLEVTSPVNGATVSDPILVVSGKTEPNAEVFINESELTADSQGNFSTTITFEEGENVVVITASDDDGNYAERELTVIHEPTD